MARKTLFNKLEQTILGIGLAFGVYNSPVLADSYSVEYKKTIGTVDINGDNNPEEFYITSTKEYLPEGVIHKVVWKKNLVMEKDSGLGEPKIKSVLATLPEEPKKTALCDYNKDNFVDISYVIENQGENALYEQRYEMYVLRGKEGGFFNAPEFVRYMNE